MYVDTKGYIKLAYYNFTGQTNGAEGSSYTADK